jgi:glycosyltransferase involved in cell wall biosynthesis
MAHRTRVPTIGDYDGTRAARDKFAMDDTQTAPNPAPLVSVITTVYNGKKTLARTIASVRAQNLPELEYIIVDAGSTDGTLDIIRANTDIVTYWQSEPDRGISDGFNKGIALTRGTYIALVHADDWLSPDQLAVAVEALERTGTAFVYGDLICYGTDGRQRHRIAGEPNYAHRIKNSMPNFNHPTVVVRRTVYEAVGLFDLTLKFAMDYELLMRIHTNGFAGVYEPRILGHMALDGVSDRNVIAANREVRDISMRYGCPTPNAWSRFLFRCLKHRGRRLVEAYMPKTAAARLRRLVNKHVTAVEP